MTWRHKVAAFILAACCLSKQVTAGGGPSLTVDDLQSLMARDMPGFVGFVMGAAQISDVDHPGNFCIPAGMTNEVPGAVARYMKNMYLASGIENRTKEFGGGNAAIMIVIALNRAFPCSP